MSNAISSRKDMSELHWAFQTLSYFDTWCGATCHTVLRYSLRYLLILAIISTLVGILVRSLDPKRRAELRRSAGVDCASSQLRRSELESVAGTSEAVGMGVKVGKNTTGLNGGPDVRDSCAVM